MPQADPLAASRSHRFRIGLGAAIVLLIVGVAIAVLASALSAGGGSTTIVSGAGVATSGGTGLPGGTGAGSMDAGGTGPGRTVAIFVHLLGEVNRPGLYRLRDGDRAVDAIAAAGGYTADADRRALNLARFLSDGEQIYVPAQGEAATPGGGAVGTVGGKVNINTADSATLETLPRVGPALAGRIIAWRETNGRFGSIEDLLSVSGIGEKTFAGLKDLVTI